MQISGDQMKLLRRRSEKLKL